MNTFEYFGQFYNSLATGGLVLFWVLIFVFFFLIFLSISLYFKNKELVLIIKRLKEEKKEVIEPIFDKKEEVKIEEIKEEPKEEGLEMSKEEEQEPGPYSKNVLREITTRHQTSPISIEKDQDKINIAKITPSNVENNSSNYEEIDNNSNISFAEEISKRMEEEIKPQTIELTDYEKKQEEEAIISYKELLNASKDRIYNITDDEETTDFIKELKSFRSSL